MMISSKFSACSCCKAAFVGPGLHWYVQLQMTEIPVPTPGCLPRADDMDALTCNWFAENEAGIQLLSVLRPEHIGQVR